MKTSLKEASPNLPKGEGVQAAVNDR